MDSHSTAVVRIFDGEPVRDGETILPAMDRSEAAIIDFCNLNQLEGDGNYRSWLRESLVVDTNCRIDAGDLWVAFKAKFTAEPELIPEPLNIKQLLNLVFECFPRVDFQQTDGVVTATYLRWKKLDEGCMHSLSVHGVPKAFPEFLRVDAHKLLYLSKSARARALLYMCFEEREGFTISLRSLWEFYTTAFSRSQDTHSLLDQAQFRKAVGISKGTNAVEVSENHIVILGLAVRDYIIPALEYLDLMRQRRLESMRGMESSISGNKFNMKLLEYPLFALGSYTSAGEHDSAVPETGVQDLFSEYNDHDTADAAANPGPFIQRLRRRSHHPRLPFGDEEPGFPGVSMKLEQKRHKPKVEAWRQSLATVFDPDPAHRYRSMDTAARSASRSTSRFPRALLECGANAGS